MKSDKLIKEIEYINKTTERISKRLEKLYWKKYALYSIIEKGISFVPYDLADAISYLVRIKEGKNYIRRESRYFEANKEQQYLILCDENESRNPNVYLSNPDNISIFSDRYSVTASLSLNHNSLTFKHLLEKYSFQEDKWVGSINSSEFEKHPYIKDFITYIAELQLENDGKILSKQEMFNAVRQFIAISSLVNSLEEYKPKIKELKKD